MTDLQEAYLVGTSSLVDLGGFLPHFYLEFDVAGLAAERIESVVNQLVARHEQLRTVVGEDGAQRVLDVAELPRLRVPVADLRDQDPRRALARTRRGMTESGHDPATWPLFDVAVSLLREHRARVHIGMSLLLLDAHSTWQVLAEARALSVHPARPLPPVPLTFRHWRRAQAAQQVDGEHWRYWSQRLDSLPPAPELPTARPLADLGPVRLTQRTCALTAAQWRQLRTTARRERIMPASALAHAFAETLGAWALNPRFCLNVLHEGWRGRHPEWAGVVGQLGATLPVEVDLSRDEDYWQRGRRLQGQLWRDLEHCDVTAVQVMRAVAARRGWTSRPALPYVFNGMLGSGPRAASAPRPTGRIAASALRTPHVLVDSQVQDAPGGGITCTWYTVDEAFPPGLPDTMFDTYRDLLHEIAAPSSAAPTLALAAHRATVAAVNDTATPQPKGRLEDGFLRQAALRPDAVAVVSDERTMTYRELESASRAVAGWLGRLGLGRGDLVPVVMVKGWEQVVAVLGVLRAGAAYCPVDAGQPVDRIRRLVGQCCARAVLATSHHPAALGEQIPVLEVDHAPAGGEPVTGVPGGVDDLAYVIHTSGSTGTPKGVMIEHRAAWNTVQDINDRIALDAGDRVFAISSLSFDLSVWDVFGTLAAGAALVLPLATPVPAPAEWARTAARHGVTVWNSVPALADLLAEVVGHQPERSRPPLRVALLSGDWIPLALPDRLRRLWSELRVIAMGGATEAAIWSNSFEVGRVDPGWRSVPYGTPLRNQRMLVLDHRMEVRPPWATGRIHIGGAGLARGYLGDAERTARRFVRHPGTGERLYWTGDLGRYWPDGTIEFLGREDRQVKVLGHRIEPGEVECAVRECPGVAECVVTTDTAPDGGPLLVALVVAEDGARLDCDRTRASLRERLPSHLVPGRIHLVAALPLTVNGKVDTAAALASLPAMQPAPLPDGADGPLTAELAGLWSTLLGVPAVAPDSDFFALGGTSLLALRLVHRIRDELAVDVPLGVVFEAPTVRALAARLRAGSGAGGETRAVRLKAGAGPALFLFHPVGGSVGCYAELVRGWPGPVHGFQSSALTGRTAATWPDLGSMAAGYRDELLRLAPDGPHVLGGWSMGGVLAHEVSRQLAGRGHRPCVVMIDSEVPAGAGPDDERTRHLAFLTDLAAGRLPSDTAAAILDADPGALSRRALDAATEGGLLPAGTDIPGYQRLMGVHRRNLELLNGHRAGHSDAPTLLFVASAADRPDPAPAWRALCRDLDVVRWPVDHYAIVSDRRLASIARRITRWLPGARADGRP
ncbi:non-ribosomal peptide synthetase [Solihabitans fulvus]|nr:non-ribosomal peptide synthetase [Solihabitans fulvus]